MYRDKRPEAGGSSCDKYSLEQEARETGAPNARMVIKEGTVPLVIRSVDPGVKLGDVSSKYIGHSLEEIAGERLSNAFFSNRGCITAYVKSSEAFRRLKAITSLSGVAVRADLPRWFHNNAGKLKDVPERYTEKNILDRLSDVGAINVRRQISFFNLPNGRVESKATQQVVVHFGPERVVPAQVKLGFTLYQVHPFVPPPVQCTKCQELYHVAKSCPNGTRCKICAGSHPHQLCTADKTKERRCANCGGDHTATYAHCPAKMREVQRQYRQRADRDASEAGQAARARRTARGRGDGEQLAVQPILRIRLIKALLI
ncbi:hypothetical protein HPB50_002100 [Hyalomma asiaticum]|uniref:Uncharacterized protein n=1 Tax=Hyalomma asiaticum TaxID=266040 RepID=A0ACB7RH86_HYAAI|nr:hypothetical protein HPB50_002100 [Hyalomma asiaticum]